MDVTRRDFLKAAAAIVAAPGLRPTSAAQMQQALAGESHVPVVWLQGAGCNGDSVAFLNSICYGTPDALLTGVIDLEYHPTVMAATGDLAVSAAEAAKSAGGYVLVIEGSIPTGSSGKFCQIWPGMTIQNALATYAPNAAWILAVGTCAAFGGVTAGGSNPTGSTGVVGILGNLPKIINIPGCPSHPDWVVGTIAYILAHNAAPALDANRRPTMYFGKKIHDWCQEKRKYCGSDREAGTLSSTGCLEELGCRGPQTYADCYMRKFNSPGQGRFGVNWCIGARSPCIGCVNPAFPGAASFFREVGD